MPEFHKPRSGSLEVWPRKRVSRIYPSVTSYPDVQECKPLVFAGYKAGMTQIIMKDTRQNSPTKNQFISVPVTILDTPPLFIIGARSYTKDRGKMEVIEEIGAAEEKIPKNIRQRVSFAEKSNLEEEGDEIRLIVSTQPQRSGLGKKEPEVFEMPLGGNFEEQREYIQENLGGEIKASDVFEKGELSDAIGVTKGKGYEGTTKRYGTKIKTRKDKERRHVGSLGTRGDGRVLFSVPQPGQDGFHQRTDEKKRILKFGEGDEVNPSGGFTNYGLVDEDYLMVKGSTPGPKKRLTMIRKSVKNGKKIPIEIKEIKTREE